MTISFSDELIAQLAQQLSLTDDLLLTDDSNPRSVVFQANELVRHVSQLPRLDDVIRNRAERRAIALSSSLMTLDVLQASSGTDDELRSALTAASQLLWQFSEEVEHTWFSHTSPSRALTIPGWVDEEPLTR